MEFALIWYSQYGKEEIDTTTNSQEAIRLRNEYQMAYGSNRPNKDPTCEKQVTVETIKKVKLFS